VLLIRRARPPVDTTTPRDDGWGAKASVVEAATTTNRNASKESKTLRQVNMLVIQLKMMAYL
jgi:hypothetical protein